MREEKPHIDSFTMAIPIQLDRASGDFTDTAASLDLPVQLRLLTEEHETSARLCRVNRGFLKLSSPVSLPADSRLEMMIDGCTIRAEVISCGESLPGTFSITLRRVFGPQAATRDEPRIPVDLIAVLTSPSCDRMFARVLDMSQSGLGFQVSDALAVGTRVSVHFACGIAFGDIIHCTAQPGAVYRAGMRIEEFVVRHGSADSEKERVAATAKLASYRTASGPRVIRRLLALTSRVSCSMAGHDYGWFTDLWERAVLRCSRCEKILGP